MKNKIFNLMKISKGHIIPGPKQGLNINPGIAT